MISYRFLPKGYKHSILSYVIYRMCLAVFTLLAVSTVNYILIRSIPGVSAFFEENVSAEPGDFYSQSFSVENYLFLDKPWYWGYFYWIQKVVCERDLGLSIQEKRPVSQSIAERIGATLFLTFPSILTAYLIAIPVGIFLATKKGKIIECLFSFLLYVMYSVPTFLMCLLLLYIFYVKIPMKFVQFDYDMAISDNCASSLWQSLIRNVTRFILPAICFSYTHFVYLVCFIRNNMLEALQQDYIQTAKAVGFSDARILYRYAFKNTLVPYITQLGFMIPSLVSGSVIVESIFQWPGVGLLFYQSIVSRDHFLIMGLILLFSVTTISGQFLADVLYHIIDPRIELE